MLVGDESSFSPNSYNRSKHWSNAGRPMRKVGKFAPHRIVFVCGIIGPSMGNVLYKMGRKSFVGEDMVDLLREIREIAGPEKKLALILDNARYRKQL